MKQKKIKQKLSRLVFIFLILFSNLACEKEKCPGAICDLVATLFSSYNSVQVGKSFNFTSTIKNAKDFGVECLTETAPKSNTKLTAEYKKNNNENFKKLSENLYEIPEIPEDNAIKENYSVKFNEAGYYKISTFADGLLQIIERLENNNEAKLGPTGAKNSFTINKDSTGLIIHVLPNNKFKRAKGEPIFEVISHSIEKVQK